MREIRCRGIATHDYETSTDGVEKGDWVYGYYYFDRPSGKGVIVTTLTAESGGVGSGVVQANIFVDHKTVSQYTGLKDKNGVEIYEGDIVRASERVENPKNRVVKYVIENGAYFVIGNKLNEIKWDDCLTVEQLTVFGYEVIGNIYENPELLEK